MRTPGIVAPNGTTYPVTVSSFGTIDTPSSIGLIVYLDSLDSDAYVWVSDNPAANSFGTPAGALLGSCGPYEFTAWTEPNNEAIHTFGIRNEATTDGETPSGPSFGAGLWRDPQPRRRAG